MDYISHVLPALGEDAVDQLAVSELVAGVEVTRADSSDVERLKADTRLAEVVRRAAEFRSQGQPAELVMRLEGRFVGVEEGEVELILRETRDELGLSAAARERFRMNVLRRFYADYGEVLGGLAVRSFEEVERALRRNGLLNGFLDRTWPAPKPEHVVRQLLSSRERLAEAADGVLDDDEQKLLRRAKAGWSFADLPLLDEARSILRGGEVRYGHVIVDEAQDLTPMQLRMIARRTTGSFTILGDVAQATGPVPYARWRTCSASFPEAMTPSSRSFGTPTVCHGRSWRSPYHSLRTSRPTQCPRWHTAAVAVHLASYVRQTPSRRRWTKQPRLQRRRDCWQSSLPPRCAEARRRDRSSTTRASPFSRRGRRRGWSSTT
jgi:hypothetical protein